MTTLGEKRAIWDTAGEEKRAAVQGMFAEIAPVYDRLNSVMTVRRHRSWRRLAVQKLQLKLGDSALDVCCGTGDFMAPLRAAVGPQGRIVGVDFCRPMLAIARQKLAEPALLVGDAGRLPVATAVFDGATVGWGLRNVPDLDLALAEIARCLKPGARLVCLDTQTPRQPVVRWASRLVSHGLLPRMGAVLGAREAYTYLPKSTERFVSREGLAEAFSRAGFAEVGYRDLMLGNVCMHWGTRG
ncbi:MAG: ubiquinone/menaquinone biosynthesis methyltransferase [Fimbriimonadaceae bacterium]